MFSRNTIESFQEQQNATRATEPLDLGVRTVEVKKIVGSVNRWQDFDSKFRFKLKSKLALERYENIVKAMEQGVILPPVVLYKIRDKYYVLDGNHRVAAAKQIGQTYIDAKITEFIPAGDSFENQLWREKSFFELRTDLSDIEFTELGLYNKLLEIIEQYRKDEFAKTHNKLTLFEASKQWYYKVYLPVVEHIRKEGLLMDFPDRTEADLFIYATFHKMAKSRLTKKRVTYKQALKDLDPTPNRSFGEKLLDKIADLLYMNEVPSDCPYGLIIDEDGLVKITRDCGGCTRCHERELTAYRYGGPRVITHDDFDNMTDYKKGRYIL